MDPERNRYSFPDAMRPILKITKEITDHFDHDMDTAQEAWKKLFDDYAMGVLGSESKSKIFFEEANKTSIDLVALMMSACDVIYHAAKIQRYTNAVTELGLFAEYLGLGMKELSELTVGKYRVRLAAYRSGYKKEEVRSAERSYMEITLDLMGLELEMVNHEQAAASLVRLREASADQFWLFSDYINRE